MENRFGIKDLVMLVMMGAIILFIALAMKQYDRQMDALDDIHRALIDESKSQGRELAKVNRNLELVVHTLNAIQQKGVTFAPPPGDSTVAVAPSPSAVGKPRGIDSVESRLAPASSPAVTPATPPELDLKNDPFAYVRLAQAKPGYAEGDTYTRGLPTMEKITPLTSSDRYAFYVQSVVLETLATRNMRTTEFVPLLAKSWTISPDGLTIKFRMRPEATFSDGQPVTPDDVVFSFNQIMDPKIEAPRQRAYYQKIEKVEKTADDEVTFRFKEPYFKSFEIAAGMFILSKSFYSKYPPEEFNKKPGLLFGSGPFHLQNPESWTPGKPLQFLRNDRYWGAAPALAGVTFKEFANDVAKIIDFRNGNTDGLTQLFPEQYDQLLKEPKVLGRSQHYEYSSPEAGYRYIGWNQKRNGKPTVFADRRVRRAMTMLTDRKWIADDLSLGYATQITGPFMPGTKQCDASIQPLPFDPEAAKTLLKGAGFSDDGNGNLKTPDGKLFKFQLTYPSGNQTYQQMALFLKDSYGRAGIIVDLNPLDWSVFGQKMKNRDFDAITLGWSSNLEGDLYQAFHSDQIKDGGDDFISYANPELDKVIEQARKTVDEPRRMELWHKAHRIIHEDQPYTFLITRKFLDFYDARFKNLQVTPLGMNDNSEWYVPSEDQKHVQ